LLGIAALSTDGQYGIFFAAHQIAKIDLTNEQCVGDVSEQVSVMSSD
jgi:putative transposase